MPVLGGARLGPYEIVRLLGAGGMGEVYRARDTRLGRHVALKILPGAAASTPDRVERFAREARATAALTHPNILAVFDVGTDHETPYLVSELLEGETLREALVPGTPWPVAKAIDVATQIARGLAAAHAHGVVHRDLKPENLFVCDDGVVKILDFGLARLTEREARANGETTQTVTEEGTRLGTAGYMAPEQVRGQPADARADLFAFGAVLYELLAGRRAFGAEHADDALTAILASEPPDLARVAPAVPPSLARIVARCLEKRPEARFQSASDLAFALEALSGSAQARDAVGQAPSHGRRIARWSVVGVPLLLAAAATGAFTARWHAPVAASAATFVDVAMPAGVGIEGAWLGPLSHDGRRLAFIVSDTTGFRLWIRSLDQATAQPVPGTDRAMFPVFWSPDDRQVAFRSEDWLKKISLDSGTVKRVCPFPSAAPAAGGGDWSRSGDMIMSSTSLYHVRPSSGTATLLTAPVPEDGEFALVFPQFLPDGRHYLYTAVRRPREQATVYLAELGAHRRQALLRLDSGVTLAEPGYLLYGVPGALVAQPFDTTRMRLSGAPARVTDGLRNSENRSGGWDMGGLGLSSGGRTLLVSHGAGPDELAWFDRGGRELGRVKEWPATAASWDLSRDGVRVVYMDNFPGVLWSIDLTSGRASRLTDGEDDADPRLSADGRTALFGGTYGGVRGIHRVSIDGGSRESVFVPQDQNPGEGVLRRLNFHDWSRDGRFALFDPDGGHRELRVVSLSPPMRSQVVLRTDGAVDQARFSPDGRWIAFNDRVADRWQVFVIPFPPTGEKWQVSLRGGVQPAWRGDGRELFFLDQVGNLLAVDIAASNAVQVGAARLLFNIGVGWSDHFSEDYAVTGDGQRFLVRVAGAGAMRPIRTIILNWPALLQRP
jgi:Tol biopolymer transport system component